MRKIKRIITLFTNFYKINYKELEVYDKDFYFGIVAMIIKYLSGFMILFFMFELVEEINGWTFHEVLFLYGFNLIGFSLWSCFFINTITLPYYIRRGDFDRFLLRPVSPLLQIMMDGFDEDSWGELLTGILIFSYAWYKLNVSLWFILVVPIFFISACFIYAGISIMFSTVSFYTIAQADFANLTMKFQEFAKYPMSIYNKGLRVIFTTVVPIGFVSYYPSQMILGYSKNYFILLWVPLVALVYFYLAYKLWNIGLKNYGSTGS